MKPCKICGKKDGKCKTCSASNKALVDVIKLLSKKKKKGKKKSKRCVTRRICEKQNAA